MGFIPSEEMKNACKVGDTVRLTKEVSAMSGKFTEGSIVKITGEDHMRGFDYEDDKGNRIIEAGRNCEKVKE